jgi:hypothetical protein
VAASGVSGVEPSGSVTRELVRWILGKIGYDVGRWMILNQHCTGCIK